MNAKRNRKPGAIRTAAAALVSVFAFACSSVGNILATDSNDKEAAKPITNPFAGYSAGHDRDANQNVVLRTKKGDRSVEVELPESGQSLSDFVIPVSPAFKDSGRAPASENEDAYRQRKPSIADREITGTFGQNRAGNEDQRHEVEQGLGLVPAEEPTPEADTSYLAGIDHIKQLYRNGRYEAALLESDDIVKSYPTDPKIYEMRGTLFERLGRGDLAVKSWNQALRLNPANQTLRKFVERKQQRSLASPTSPPQGGQP